MLPLQIHNLILDRKLYTKTNFIFSDTMWKTYPKETFFALSLIILLFLLLLFTYILKLRDKKISDIEKSGEVT